MIDLYTIDIEKYLDHRGILYSYSGKNVQQGWIGIQCVWCDDHSNHLGINLSSKTISCWKCGQKGTILKLIMKLERCNLDKANQIAKNFQNVIISDSERSFGREQDRAADFDIQKYSLLENSLLETHRRFLESRNFDPELVFQKYGLKCCGPIGRFRQRLIIPVFYNYRMVTFVTRSVINEEPHYWNLPKKDSILHAKEVVYGGDKVEETLLVVEGPLDQWRIGDGCVCTFGSKWTLEQFALLKRFRRVFVLYDSQEEEAQRSAKKLVYDLSPYVDHAERLELEKGDPADLNEQEVKWLRKEIFGKL